MSQNVSEAVTKGMEIKAMESKEQDGEVNSKA